MADIARQITAGTQQQMQQGAQMAAQASDIQQSAMQQQKLAMEMMQEMDRITDGLLASLQGAKKKRLAAKGSVEKADQAKADLVATNPEAASRSPYSADYDRIVQENNAVIEQQLADWQTKEAKREAEQQASMTAEEEAGMRETMTEEETAAYEEEQFARERAAGMGAQATAAPVIAGAQVAEAEKIATGEELEPKGPFEELRGRSRADAIASLMPSAAQNIRRLRQRGVDISEADHIWLGKEAGKARRYAEREGLANVLQKQREMQEAARKRMRAGKSLKDYVGGTTD